jgi:hypothetical protein
LWPRVALAVLLVCVGLDWGTARAAGTRTINSARYGYSFSYPASWTVGQPNSAYDALVRSPDGATTFAVQVTSGNLATKTVRTTALGLLHRLLGLAPNAKLAATISTPAQPGGSAVQAEARGLVSGQHRFGIVRLVGYDGFAFFFYGTGPTPPTIQVDAPAIALRGILASVALRSVRVHFSAPTVQFGLYYPTGWRRVSYPALGKIVLDGPGGAVIFADFGHGASNVLDLRLLLLDNAGLMGKLSSKNPASFNSAPLLVDGTPIQLVQVEFVDKLGRTLTATIADASLNGYNYVFGGAAPKGSTAEQVVIDTIASATMRPPALPPDRGTFVGFSSAGHHYQLQRPAAWIASEHSADADAAFTSRDGNLTMSVLVRKGTVDGVLASLTHTLTQGLTINKQTTTPVSLGTLSAQERVLQVTIVPKLVEEIHLVAATSGDTVYVLSWNFYVGIKNAAALQGLARRSQGSFTLTG